MKFIDKIIRYENFLPQKIFDGIMPHLHERNWGLSYSHSQYQAHKVFWGMQLDINKFFNETIFEQIKETTKKKFKINQILANAQSALQDGSPHIDTENPKGITFIIYANTEWDYQWGGQTIFFDRYRIYNKLNNSFEDIVNSSDVHTIFPVPNTAVYFPSNMYHYAMGPSRDYYGLRYTVAFHLEEI